MMIFFATVGGILIHIAWISFVALFVIKVFELSDFKIEWFDWSLLNVSVFMTPVYILIVGIVFMIRFIKRNKSCFKLILRKGYFK